MATVNPTGTWISRGVHKTTWEGLLSSGDTVGAHSGADLSDKTVQAEGTFNSGVITMFGSNNTTTGPWAPLVDPQGNVIALSSATQIETILENPLYIKPLVSGATGGTTVNVHLLSRGGK